MDSFPKEFDVSPAVQEWIRNASPEKRRALTGLLVVLKEHYLPGGTLLRITTHENPLRLPASFNVPFDDCLLLYQVPLRTEDQIKLLLVLDPFDIPPREGLEG